MEASDLQLTPEQRHALLTHPDEPLYISDQETQRIYVLVEKGKFPELEEDYIRQGLELAREQIKQGQISTASIDQVVAKAQQRQSLKP